MKFLSDFKIILLPCVLCVKTRTNRTTQNSVEEKKNSKIKVPTPHYTIKINLITPFFTTN